MIKKVIFLIFSLLLFVVFITYGDFFEFKLNEVQLDTLKKSLLIYTTLTFLCFIIGELSKNYSQVDKVWSIAPIIYVWFFTIHSEFNLRMVLMSILVTIWGIRLTYNFSRKSGYMGGTLQKQICH